MRVMILAKSTPEAESAPPSPEANPEGWEAMARFSEELTNAGILLDAGRLHPSSKGARVRFEATKRTVVDGPFTEAKELVAGYWIWQVQSLDEAIEWLERAPFDGTELEIRPLYEAGDLGEAMTPELHEQDERARATAAARQS